MPQAQDETATLIQLEPAIPGAFNLPPKVAVQVKHAAQLLSLSADTLLQKFGSGQHAPGSGSAAALSGILSSKLLQTVASLTKSKPKYADVHQEMEVVLGTLQGKVDPSLYHSFQRDSDLFNKVIEARRLRDNSIDAQERRQFADQEREFLRAATEVPLDICALCLLLARTSLTMFDIGFRSARGDSGVAGTLALAGAEGAIFVVCLNLKSLRGSDWARRTREKCDSFLEEVRQVQTQLFSRVTKLREESSDSKQLLFPL